MRRIFALALIACANALAMPAHAISNFQHVILVVQENRTPDNLFYALCLTLPASCSTADNTKYDIQTAAWLDKESSTGITNPSAVPLANDYDLDHSHKSFLLMCDAPANTTLCKMDGAASIHCSGANCPANPQFKYVDNSTSILGPYLTLVRSYGWANLMFQTNQGPSFPAHQFLFGATSAPSLTDDTIGTFASENYVDMDSKGGCISRSNTEVPVIDANGIESEGPYPCFEHRTISDLLNQNLLSWRYYATNTEFQGFNFGMLWNAPLAIRHICLPNNQVCSGALFQNNVDLNPSDVLAGIQNPACNLQNVLWVTPTGQNSDHALYNTGAGPAWVASIVNAVGQSTCNYWATTAIVVLWDDWGGWYDHEAPTFLPPPYNAYQYGFRVPMVFISAYTPPGYIDNNRSDFGTVARFLESNFGIPIGALGFADNRGDTTQRLQGFYNFQQTSRPFVPISTARDAASFINDKSPPLPPDDD